MKAKRYTRGELDVMVSDDMKLRAAEAVRVFCASDGGLLLQILLLKDRDQICDILTSRAGLTTHAAYAEASGKFQYNGQVLDLFDRIINNAERLKNG